MPHSHISSWKRSPDAKASLSRLKGSKYKIIDAHLHVIDFVQNKPDGEELIESMDRANIPKSVIFGLPVAKMWSEPDRDPPDYYLANDSRCYYYSMGDINVAEMVRALSPEKQSRLFPLMCGMNPTDKFAIRDVKRLYELYPDVWSGIGELLLRHDDLTAFTYGEPARANHRALWPIYEFAAEHDLPVLLHQNVTSVGNRDYPVYLYELEEALRDFPQTRFVFAHCGISRRVNVPFYHKMISRLLEQFSSLCIDYSWIVFDEIICPNGQPNEDWLELTENFSDRICLGSDLVRKFERLGPEMQRYDVFLDQLSEETRTNICWNTPERIYDNNKGKVNFKRNR